MRAFWILIVAVKVRPHRVAAGQFFYRWSVAFDFRKCRARREAKLLGEDVENARETYERRVFSNCSGRKLAEIKFALLLRRRHAEDLIIKRHLESVTRWRCKRLCRLMCGKSLTFRCARK